MWSGTDVETHEDGVSRATQTATAPQAIPNTSSGEHAAPASPFPPSQDSAVYLRHCSHASGSQLIYNKHLQHKQAPQQNQ